MQWKSAPYALEHFHCQKFPVIQQNKAWEKSSYSTNLMHAFGGLKCFLVVAEALKSHHVSFNRSKWREWVQLGPTYSEAIFGRCCRNKERLETAGAGFSRPQKRHRSLWLADDLKCPNWSLNQRTGYWKSVPYALEHFLPPKVCSKLAK